MKETQQSEKFNVIKTSEITWAEALRTDAFELEKQF
jgi:hypothetical protein